MKPQDSAIWATLATNLQGEIDRLQLALEALEERYKVSIELRQVEAEEIKKLRAALGDMQEDRDSVRAALQQELRVHHSMESELTLLRSELARVRTIPERILAHPWIDGWYEYAALKEAAELAKRIIDGEAE